MHSHHEVNFSTDVEGLGEAQSPELVRLRDGETHEIEIRPVRKRINQMNVAAVYPDFTALAPGSQRKRLCRRR